MGIKTLMTSKSVYYLAWGETLSKSVRQLVEGEVSESTPASFLQNHKHVEVLVDRAASADLTRIATPWLTGPCEWTDELMKKGVFWLCRHLDKPILKLTARDYNDNGMSDLITERGPFSKINIDMFNRLQHTITGWPGGKPNADDSTRPKGSALSKTRNRIQPPSGRRCHFHGRYRCPTFTTRTSIARSVPNTGNIAVFDHEAYASLIF